MSHPENNPSPYGNNPYGQGNTPPPVPPAPAPQQQSPYANIPYSPEPTAYGNSPYENSPYANNGVPQNIQSEEGRKKGTLAIVFGIIGLFFFPIIFGSLAIMKGKQANELGGNGKPGIILGCVGFAFWIIGMIFYFSNR